MNGWMDVAMVCFKLTFLQGYEKLLRVDCSLDLWCFKNHPFFKFPARELHCHHLVDVLYLDLNTAIPQAVADGMARGLSPEQATGPYFTLIVCKDSYEA